MAFLDEIDKKLTMIGQGAIQKTKEVSDTAKINVMVRNLESQKKECFENLGKLFYVCHKGVADEQEMVFIQKIEEMNCEIERLQGQMSRLKGIIICPNCNAEIPASSIFCNSCGAKIEKPLEIPNVRVCRQCGNPLAEGQIFCSSCGTRVEVVYEEEREIKEQEYQKESLEMQEKKICPICGEVVDDEQPFCIYCGTELHKI